MHYWRPGSEFDGIKLIKIAYDMIKMNEGTTLHVTRKTPSHHRLLQVPACKHMHKQTKMALLLMEWVPWGRRVCEWTLVLK